MSWEGYAQVFCENGHLHGNWDDPYYFGGEEEKRSLCPNCGARPAFTNVVDDTNYDNQGILTDDVLKTLLISEEKTATCNLGHVHIIQAAVYRIITEEEARGLSSFMDPATNTYIRYSSLKDEGEGSASED